MLTVLGKAGTLVCYGESTVSLIVSQSVAAMGSETIRMAHRLV
jgi:hypothetical protein